MKYTSVVLPIILSISLAGMACVAGAEAAETAPVAPGGDARYQKLAQDADRNREMIEIWKEHVRTLTRERDEAYKQIEDLKVTGGALPEEPLAQSDSASLLREKEAAQSRVRELEGQVQRLKDAQAAQNQTIEARELAELRSDKELILQQKEKALASLETLQREADALRAENEKLNSAVVLARAEQPAASPADSKAYRDLEQNLRSQQAQLKEFSGLKERLDSEVDALERQVRTLKSENARLTLAIQQAPATPKAPAASSESLRRLELENEALKARADKLPIVESELEEARQYFSSLIKELEARNKKLEEESRRLAEESRRAELESREIRSNAEKSTLETVRKTEGELARIARDKEIAEQARVETERVAKAAESELKLLRASNKSLEAKLAAVSSRVDEAGQESAALRRERDDLAQKAGALQNQEASLASQTAKLKDLEGDLSRARAERDAAQERRTAIEAKSKLQDEKLRALDAEKGALERDLETARTDAERLRSSAQEAKTLEAELAEMRSSQGNVQKDRDDLVRQVQSLRFQLEKSQSKSARVKELEDELRAEKAGQENFKAGYAEIEKRALDSETRAKAIAAEKAAALDKAATLGRQIESLRAAGDKLKAVEEELENERSLRKLANQEREEAGRRLSDLTAETQTMKAESEKLKLVESELAETRTYLSSVIKGLEESNQRLSGENAGLRLKVDDAQKGLRQLESAKALSEERLKELESSARRLSDEAEALKERAAGAERRARELENLRTRNADLEAKLEANASDLKNLKENFDALMEPLLTDVDRRK